jgi:hypothetical protein
MQKLEHTKQDIPLEVENYSTDQAHQTSLGLVMGRIWG